MDSNISIKNYQMLKKDAERYRWIKQQKNLNLRTNKTQGTPWTNAESGNQYYPSHCLDVNGTGFNGIEHLDDLIDQAMELYPLTDNQQ